MEKQLKLYGNYGKYDDTSFVVAGNETLSIILTDKPKPKINYYATIQKDNLTEKIKIEDNKFEIPIKFLTFGEISVKISLYNKSELMKEYVCEQLLIKELSNEKVLIPEIIAFKQELAENKQLLLENLKNFKERIAKIEELMMTLYNISIELKGDTK